MWSRIVAVAVIALLLVSVDYPARAQPDPRGPVAGGMRPQPRFVMKLQGFFVKDETSIDFLGSDDIRILMHTDKYLTRTLGSGPINRFH